MINSLKKVWLIVTTLTMFALPTVVPVAVYASTPNISGNICGGIDASASATSCSSGNANGKVSKLLTDAIELISWLVGIVSVIMIMVGGFQYVVSNGDSSKISTAKNTIIFALVGLIIVAMAQFIVHFVIGRVNNAISS